MDKTTPRTPEQIVVLDRILSLLPKKPNGDFVRGAKKDFAIKLGYDSGDIVTMWINGSSNSYMGKLYDISAIYNVSIEYLRGETDQKNKPTLISESELDETTKELFDILTNATEEEREALLNMARLIKRRRD